MIQRKIDSVVITGPTGAIGMAVCAKMLEEGITVWAVCRPDSPRIEFLPKSKKLHLVMCDVDNFSKLPQLIPDTQDAFFHFAWAHTIGAGRNDMTAQVNNINCTLEAVRAAAELKCKVFVGAGSQAEYGRVDGILHADTVCNPENGYGMAKLCAGQMSRVECQRFGIDHIWTRILSVYGPYDSSATMIYSTICKLLAGEKPTLTAGTQIWDYLYSKDAADAFYHMALRGKNGAIYPLGSGEARPLREYIEILRDTINPELPLGLGEIPYGTLQVMHLQADISALKEDTGFIPCTKFEEGIRNTIEWIRSKHNV